MASPKMPSVYFNSLEIENVRCFGDLQKLDLTADGRRPAQWTLILGDNGVGKTTLLQALAWMRPVTGRDNALLAEAEDNSTLERLLRQGSGQELTLRANWSIGSSLSSARSTSKGNSGLGKPIETFLRLFFDDRGLLSEEREPEFNPELPDDIEEPLVVVYGADRRRGLRNAGKMDFEGHVASRLSEFTELYDIEQILSDLDYASSRGRRRNSNQRHLNQLKESLTRILPEEVDANAIHIYPPDILNRGERSGVHLKSFTGMIPLSALSLGYQTTLSWTGDLAWRLQKHYAGRRDPLSGPAVVLIDEIDLHLHPLWQLRIIDDLSSVFPRTQFIATAHSPLMVQVAETANFALLRKRQSDVEIVNEPEDVRSWRVDQILVSELFGVPRARDKQTEELFRRRDELLDMVTRSEAEAVELEELRSQISRLPTAQDPEDRRAMEFIREAAALLKARTVGA